MVFQTRKMHFGRLNILVSSSVKICHQREAPIVDPEETNEYTDGGLLKI
jgi:hypothetical protein